ncbi:class F sortase [Streptomyces sp. NBC_01558]|uniref:class F sortase n=1 Tax=unclassified Streptomyces TaxID=2593676 RepID=UPI002DDB02A5|nr:class F sortase [Streptomyces sp. NBC_01558]WSD75055.1 class F sortase [Streptomyces sp. NBC_01558]
MPVDSEADVSESTADTSQQRTTAMPIRIRIPAIGIDQPLTSLRVQQDGHLAAPSEPEQIGWWSDGPRPGNPGATVIVGHVDSTTGPAAFYNLSTLHPGDKVTLLRKDRSTISFTIRALRQYEKDAFPDSQVYATSGPPALHLITCSGAYDRGRGEYQDNLVVYATLTSAASASPSRAARHPAARSAD